ncbi:sugar ABC transporter substrate-binding protein [Cnuibacter physcomitrellae]|uniref:Sugar ABC transporter substrate-binding protein n=1 Tax=Cnuibacter physcomitrellae TaxID=1619308 RepID=A0A1X9LTL5_9MICO|nr:sugar ABC transporter substrate-binding protein [Cnuibacter physcomitrellae]ARJ05270.1 sugar ABC transporter substrate-binding protein [Cnuibacter physcomitrellae]MCS5498549.1 sugar ABC transporter substrate-binding protein [Cnuibacter physcomitrellae]GGI35331.1 sugar ABC transporter substrate-binding protein [Cnuibacter physcomitrellae]
MRRSTFLPFAMATVATAALLLSGCTPQSDTSGGGQAASMDTVKVALVPGGPHPYFQPWIAAGEEAKSTFGLGDVTFNETAGWDQTKQNDVINSLVANGYTGFGVFGVSPTDINSTFQNLKQNGIATAALGSCPAGDTNDADFCLSTDTEEAAYKAAKATIEAMGGKGVLAHLTGINVDSNTQRRIAGVKKAVAETNGAVTLLPDVTDIDTDLTTAQKAVADLLASQGSQITGIVSTAYNPAVAAATAVAESGLPIKLVAIDDDETIIKAIQDGTVYATVAQNPTGQAYVGSYALAKLASKECTMSDPGVVVDSGSFIVTKDNVATYDDERKAASDQLLKDFDDEYLTCS